MAKTNALELARDELERRVPAHFDEGFAPAQCGIAGLASFEPPGANGRTRDAQRRVHHLRNGGEHRRGMRIERERLATHHASLLDDCGECAPVRKGREATASHRDPRERRGSNRMILTLTSARASRETAYSRRVLINYKSR